MLNVYLQCVHCWSCFLSEKIKPRIICAILTRSRSSPLYLERRRSAVTRARSTEQSSTAMTHGSTTSLSSAIGTTTLAASLALLLSSSPACPSSRPRQHATPAAAAATSIVRYRYGWLVDRHECSRLCLPSGDVKSNQIKRWTNGWMVPMQCDLRPELQCGVYIYIRRLPTYRNTRKDGAGGISIWQLNGRRSGARGSIGPHHTRSDRIEWEIAMRWIPPRPWSGDNSGMYKTIRSAFVSGRQAGYIRPAAYPDV